MATDANWHDFFVRSVLDANYGVGGFMVSWEWMEIIGVICERSVSARKLQEHDAHHHNCHGR